MKRRRVSVSGPSLVVRGGSKRPIEKNLISVSQTSTTTATLSTLKTTTFPGTVVGLRWSINVDSNVTTADPLCVWAIVRIPDGESVKTPAISDGSNFYQPEENVLAFGSARVVDADNTNGPNVMQFDGSTKTMRKLKQGDVLGFVTLNSVASGCTVRGIIQFFFKT